MIISLENISKHYSGEQVLDNVSLTIEDGRRSGLIGVNGCGKSTLLRIIIGLENPDSQPEPNTPRRTAAQNKKIGFLAQDSGLDGELTIIDEMKSVFAELLSTAQRLAELQQSGNLLENRELADEYSRKTAYFECNDGYSIDAKINKILNGMGFAPELRNRIISTLSGGERTRLALAKLLLENPDLLILDEPTNHLDFETVMWLEDYLKDYKGTILTVSHDRYFLDKLVTEIYEIERGKIRLYKGNYTAFVKQKAEYAEFQMKEYEAQTAEIAKLKDYIARNITRASTSNMAKSRVKQLEKIEAERIPKPFTYGKSPRIRFTYEREPHKSVLTVKNLTLAAGGKMLVNSLSFDVQRGERLAVIGANGSGKSTLLKALMSSVNNPAVEWGENVKIAYFEQTNTDIFDDGDTACNSVHKLYPRMTEFEVRSLLASVGLVGDDAFKKVGSLSGGERAKLRMAIMFLEKGNVLILDEPTNHLDIYARDALESALCDYTGTVIFVSHDRYLLSKLSTRILEISPDGTHDFKGGFDEFTANRRNSRENSAAVSEKEFSPNSQNNKKKSDNSTSHRSKEQRAEEARKRQRNRELETEISRLEALISDLQAEIETKEVFSNYELLQEKCRLCDEAKTRLSELTDEWLMIN